MKTLHLYIAVFFFSACSAQVNIKDQNGRPAAGTYYQDTDGILDAFVGTYVFSDGSVSLKFVFQKKINNPNTWNGNSYTEDLLVGEYRYAENGVEKVNTLDSYNINFFNARSHSFYGNMVVQGTDLGCDDCSPEEMRVLGYLRDAQTQSSAQIILRKKWVNGQEVIAISIWWQRKVRDADDDGAPLKASFPGGNYLLVKQ